MQINNVNAHCIRRHFRQTNQNDKPQIKGFVRLRQIYRDFYRDTLIRLWITKLLDILNHKYIYYFIRKRTFVVSTKVLQVSVHKYFIENYSYQNCININVSHFNVHIPWTLFLYYNRNRKFKNLNYGNYCITRAKYESIVGEIFVEFYISTSSCRLT